MRWRFVHGWYIRNDYILMSGKENERMLMSALGRAQRRRRRIAAGKLKISFTTGTSLKGECVWHEELTP